MLFKALKIFWKEIEVGKFFNDFVYNAQIQFSVVYSLGKSYDDMSPIVIHIRGVSIVYHRIATI